MCLIQNEKSITDSLELFDPISLQEMDGVRLLDRVDIKFMFNLEQLPEILSLSAPYYKALTIAGMRFGHYETRYFDTPDYEMYTKHHNGKLNRYKIRFRTYVDSDLNFFEIKFKTNTGRTKKLRIKNNSNEFQIDGDSKRLLENKTNYQANSLQQAIQVNYNRITLVSKNCTERLTLDFGMTDIYNHHCHDLPNLVIAEVKQDRAQNSPFIELMKSKHIGNSALSKYCLGVASCIPNVKTNQFKSKLLHVNKLCYSNS